MLILGCWMDWYDGRVDEVDLIIRKAEEAGLIRGREAWHHFLPVSILIIITS